MRSNLLVKTGLVAVVAGMVACNNASDQNNKENQTAMNDTTATAAAAGTTSGATSLFDGNSLAGWHGFNKTGEVTNWTIEDGALVCLGAAKGDTGGDIVSDKEYGNFELSWDWKIEKGGNSGVMYHVVEAPRYKGPYETGPEYQLIDDEGYPDKLEDWQKTGADYAMNVANDKKKVNAIGEWNSSKIIYNNGHVEHWLNGEKIVEFQAGDEKWNKEKISGKWKDFPDYGVAKKGRIALQDHGKKAYFKNINIVEL